MPEVRDGYEDPAGGPGPRGNGGRRRTVAVNSDEEARRLRFLGSPTIRIDGRDLFPAGEREDWRLGCRVYATLEGLKGSPTTEMFREALTKEGSADAGLHC